MFQQKIALSPDDAFAFEKSQDSFSLDALTGLATRDAFVSSFNLLENGSRGYSALLVVDLDDLKSFNNAFGYATGDILLCNVARQLSLCVGDNDLVARLGDDEFGILLREISCDKELAISIAKGVGNKITGRLKKFWGFEERECQGSVSVGIAVFVGGVPEEMLRQASIAMHHAKTGGSNAAKVFDPQMLSAAIAKADLVSDLRKALLRQEFFVVYQAQVDGAGRVTGAEALVRWNHPQRGRINPRDFIYSAEQSGLIVPLGRWVLEVACAQLEVWSHKPTTVNLTISVNVSSIQFHQDSFVDDVLKVVNQSGADARRLKLELTENLLVEDFGSAIEKMRALQEHGIHFSLDDFGTGPSSLSHLKNLPLDQMKIDMSFITNVLNCPSDAAIVRMLISLAEEFNVHVIAEGIETVGQRDFLARHGCFDYQGFLFGKPMPIELFNQSMLEMSAAAA